MSEPSFKNWSFEREPDKKLWTEYIAHDLKYFVCFKVLTYIE